jgi:hypothetical protein
MKNFIQIFALVTTLSHPLMSLAEECPGNTRLDQASQVEVELVAPLSDIKEDSIFGDVLDTTVIYFSKGVLSNSLLVAAGRSIYERQIAATFQTSAIHHGMIQPFHPCRVTNIELQDDEIQFIDGCPLASLHLAHADPDLNDDMFDLNSLRYNLGSRFKVTAQCNSHSK